MLKIHVHFSLKIFVLLGVLVALLETAVADVRQMCLTNMKLPPAPAQFAASPLMTQSQKTEKFRAATLIPMLIPRAATQKRRMSSFTPLHMWQTFETRAALGPGYFMIKASFR